MKHPIFFRPLPVFLIAFSVVIPTAAFAEPGGEVKVQEKPAFEREAVIFNIEGDVKILKANAEQWTPAQKGMALGPGDQIVTGVSAQLDISFDPDLANLMHIEEKTKAEIRSVTPSDIFLSDGTLFSALDGLRPGESFSIATPTAVASVRGTHFTSVFNGENKSGVFALVPNADGRQSQLEITRHFDNREDAHFVLQEGDQFNYEAKPAADAPPPIKKIENEYVTRERALFDDYEKKIPGFTERRNKNVDISAGGIAAADAQAEAARRLEAEKAAERRRNEMIRSTVMKEAVSSIADEAGLGPLGSGLGKLFGGNHKDSEDTSDLYPPDDSSYGDQSDDSNRRQ